VGKALKTLKAEMAKTRAGKKSELMDLLTVYHWKDLFGPFTRDPATIKQAKKPAIKQTKKPAKKPAELRRR